MYIHGIRRSIYTIFAVMVSLSAMAANHLAPERVSDISNTKHNFAANADVSLTGGVQRQVKAVSQNELCVFCHTPHGDGTAAEPFLWNRAIPNAFTYYSSNSLDAGPLTAIGKPSKMCMSCHDGAVAVGAIKMVNGKAAAANIEMTGNGVDVSGKIKDAGSGHGNYNLGPDFSNDHPIGFVYNSTLATNDGELVDPSTTSYIATRVGSSVANRNVSVGGATPPLQPTTAITRAAVPLHSDLASGTIPASGLASLQNTGSLECTSCHDPHIRSTNLNENIKFLRLHRFQKATPSGGTFNINTDQNCLACHKKAAWNTSVHANSTDATNSYTNSDAAIRDFPSGTRVWEAGCLNCHDTHTENGAKLLLREGANASSFSATEEACYQCHSSTSVLQTAAKDIKTVSNLTGGHSPTTPLADDVHAIGKKGDNVIVGGPVIGSGNHAELQTNLTGANRHAECSDCHHPHRAQRNVVYDGADWTDPSLLSPLLTNNFARGFAKGSVRGVWGVEPSYTVGAAWTAGAASYTVLQGDKSDPSSYTGTTFVTKEYQVCFKCHSGFANGAGKTDKAMEFQSNGAAGRSWHPVYGATGRDSTNVVLGYSEASLNAPFNTASALGKQTMNCSDCHASDVSNGTKGPHGSVNTGILIKANNDSFCLTCHSSTIYDNNSVANTGNQISGFSCANGTIDCQATGPATGTKFKNLHNAHTLNTCDTCHVKSPHGWKIKALLVNQTSDPGSPYYSVNGTLAIGTVRASGAWTRADCTTGGCHL